MTSTAAAPPAGSPGPAEPVVRYEMSDGIAVVTLNRPARLNAVIPELVEALCAALDRARADDAGACVVTGAGRAFCAGHDLRYEAGDITEGVDRYRVQRIQDVTRKVRQAPFPVIAAVHGYALGAGCEFALCCDLVVASRDAHFGFPEIEVGLGVTGGISHLLPLMVGPAKAKELVLTGERFDAREAHRLNLVNRLAEPGDHLSCALELAQRLRDRPRRAMARAKLALDIGPQVGIETSLEIETANALALHNGPDAQAAAAAFRQRPKGPDRRTPRDRTEREKAPMPQRFRVTYATLSADNEDLHAAYDEGLRLARSWLGQTISGYVSGQPRSAGPLFDVVSPADGTVLCHVHEATAGDVSDAVAAAEGAAAGWAATPWQDRIALLRRAADLISDRSNELAALMSMEVGKNRLEALGDVEETADLIRYYCQQIEDNDGFDHAMGTLSDREKTRSVMRPFGVWAVISPFNFPMALAGGPVGAALAAGNTVLLKPSRQGSFTAAKLYECLRDAGLPADVLHLLPGGDETGAAIVAHPGVDGLTFTGSYEAGMSVYRGFAGAYPKPVICEMGGKNPAIVSARADLDTAAAGVARSAFGFSGQKCSACSRVYVQRDVYPEFVEKLAAQARGLVVGDPTERSVFVGPVIDDAAVQRYERAVAHARERGRVVAGGEVLRKTEGYGDGNYVEPAVVADVPADDWLFADELFIPFVAVAPVDSVDEALELANSTKLGLTAGFFSADQAEVDAFLTRIQAGVVYVNRAAGATTGAWPGVQPFGGWKGSGSSGKAGGGLYYVQQYLREQSQTVTS